MKIVFLPIAFASLLPQFAFACYTPSSLGDILRALLDFALLALLYAFVFGGLVYLRVRFAKKHAGRSSGWRLKAAVSSVVVFWLVAMGIVSGITLSTYLSKPCVKVSPACGEYCNPL